MADPLSIAASIAGVISLADIVFIRTRKYLSSAKNADKDVRDLSQEVLLLSGALHSLSRLAQALDADGLKDQHIDSLRMHHIAACHATLDEVAKKLKKFEDCGTKRKLIWPFVSDRTRDLLADISRHKDNINLALTADSMGTLLRILSKTEEVQVTTQKLMEDARRTREIVTRIQEGSERTAILDYFLPYNPQQNYEMSLSLRHPRTGLWLTHRPEFQTWLDCPGSALWLSGIPGAGKTVLAGTVVEEALRRSSESVATVFFFCDYKNARTQRAENVLSALASQLAIQKEEAYDYLERYYRELHPGRRLESRPDVSGLQKVLEDMAKTFDQVYLIVDGLDECGDNTDNVIDSILCIFECSDNVSTSLLSRDEYNIRDRLDEDFTGVEIAAHTEDITEYVTSEIEKRIANKSLRIDDLSLKGEILERLIDGAKGMFRWVACQLDFLGDCISDRECRDALGKLPPGLNESYMRILQRVPTGKERTVQMILNFIAYAEPQMDIPKLREAISVPENVGKDDTLDPQSIIREVSITRLCRSFIRKSSDGFRYEFAHFSVQEFLEGKMTSMLEFEAFRVSKSICQLLLAKQCLKYLVFRNFSHLPTEEHELQDYLDMRNQQYPFYFYSSTCWPVFARDHWADKSLVELAKTLFQPNNTGNFISWALELASFVAIQPRSPSSLTPLLRPGTRPNLGEEYIRCVLDLLPQLVDRKFTTLHMAAALSLPMICSSLIGHGAGIDQRSSFGSPLQCAVQGLFLADRNDGKYLHRIYPYCQYSYWQGQKDVSEFGRENTIRLLLRSGANRVTACSSPFEGQTLITAAINTAIPMNSLGAIAVLLEAGYELGEDDLSQFANLSKRLMVGGNSRDLESLILCLSPIVDRSAAHFRLCKAAWWRAIELGCDFTQDPSIVDTRISLSQDALVKKVFDSVRRTDTETLAEALKDPRANIADLTDDTDKTIFEVWLKDAIGFNPEKRLTIFKMLLSAGMKFDQPDQNGMLPIHHLAVWDHGYSVGNTDFEFLCEVVREFIGRGTGCMVKSRANQNVFHLGVRSPVFMRAMLERETEENILTALRTLDEDGNTPIKVAIQAEQEKVALLLLERSNCDRETLGDPIAILTLCVDLDAVQTFKVIAKGGIGLEGGDTTMGRLWHHVGPRTSKRFVLQLLSLFPDGARSRIGGKLPLDAYLERCRCIGSGEFALDIDVFFLLAMSSSDEFKQKEEKIAWEELVLSVRDDDSRPISIETICGFLRQTKFWESIRDTDAILGLLKAAVKSCNVELAHLLLKNGVSVHQRIGEMSALEVACLQHSDGSDVRSMFALLLDNADLSRLDEINPHRDHGKGLIHYLVGRERQWRLQELLKRGVDVNLRTEFHFRPAIVQHLLHGTSESAINLLESGADPTISDSTGLDAALAAAYRGNTNMLLHLHMAESKDWQINWQKTISGTLIAENGRKIVVLQANALHWAAWSGYRHALRFYIDNGLVTDVNAVSIELFTPMHVAAFNGQLDAIKFLFSRGGNLNLKSANGSLPLHLAARNEKSEVVKFLLDNGSAMDADGYGLTPVGYAMQLQNQSILDCLRTTKQYLDYQSKPGRREQELVCAYEQALIRGNVKECERLRGQGCPVNVDLPGQHGRSALVLAIEDSKKELIKWLLTHGAEIVKQELMKDGNVKSPLQALIMQPSLNDVLLLLLERYEDEGGSLESETPGLICIAVQCDNTAGLEMLLDHVARNNHTISTDGPNGPDFNGSPLIEHKLNGEAPLHVAAKRGNCEAIKLLLDHGANVNAVNYQQKTPLQLAIEHEPSKKSPAAKLLLHRGASMETRDEMGQTAVLLASQRGRTDMVRLFDESGADLKATDFDSWTCLHFAAHFDCLRLFVWLVERGLQLHVKDSTGWPAIQYASFRTDFSSFLLSFGSAFDNSEAMTYATAGDFMNVGPAWLNEHFNMYLRRLGPERLRTWANLEPTDSWSPLCMLASIGRTLAVTNILRLGAEVDFEGSPSGSALMVACAAGRLEPVKILVRHGASICYSGPHGTRSAVDAAKNHKAILAWLLVVRFTEQKRISDPTGASSFAHTAHIVKDWSGVAKAELIITGTAERQVHESARDYWIRLMAVKRGWRGRIIRQNERVQTHRPSRLNPVESVRICPGDYGVPKERK